MKSHQHLQLILIILLFTCKSLAQIVPAHFTSANLSFDTGKNNNKSDGSTAISNSTNIYTNLRWATLLKNNWMVGFSTGFNFNNQTDINEQGNISVTSKSASKSLQIGPFVRKYFSITDKWNLYTQGQITAGFGSSKITQEGIKLSELSEKEIAASVGAGINYSINNRWIIELQALSCRYSFSNTPKNNYNTIERTQSRFSLNTFMDGLNLGVIYVY